MARTKTISLGILTAALTASLLFSCSRIKSYIGSLRADEANPPVARVYDTYLHKSDLPDIVPAGSSAQDSAAIIDRYIDTWVTRQLILNTTQMNMPAGALEKELAEFRELLLTGRYEQLVVSQRLDTLVSEQEIQDYYREHTSDFVLNKDILCWSYLPVTYCDHSLRKKLRTAFARDKAPGSDRSSKKQTPAADTSWNWYDGVKQVMTEASYDAPFIRDEWTEVESLLGKYTAEKDFVANASRQAGYSFTVENDQGVYLGRISRYVRRGSQAPIQYVRNQIKSIILNHRTNQTLRQAEAELREQAIKNQKLEIFKPE